MQFSKCHRLIARISYVYDKSKRSKRARKRHLPPRIMSGIWRMAPWRPTSWPTCRRHCLLSSDFAPSTGSESLTVTAASLHMLHMFHKRQHYDNNPTCWQVWYDRYTRALRSAPDSNKHREPHCSHQPLRRTVNMQASRRSRYMLAYAQNISHSRATRAYALVY